jgi:hypothetical protein
MQAGIVVLADSFEMSKQEKIRKSEGAKSGEFDGCGAIRKTFSLQNTCVAFAVCGRALSTCTANFFSSVSPVEQRSR